MLTENPANPALCEHIPASLMLPPRARQNLEAHITAFNRNVQALMAGQPMLGRTQLPSKALTQQLAQALGHNALPYLTYRMQGTLYLLVPTHEGGRACFDVHKLTEALPAQAGTANANNQNN